MALGSPSVSSLLANRSLASSSLSMLTPASTDSSNLFHTPNKYWDIYVDDYCGVVQGNKWQQRMVKRLFFKHWIKCLDLWTMMTLRFARNWRQSRNSRKMMRVGPPARLSLVGPLIKLTKQYAYRSTMELDYGKYLIRSPTTHSAFCCNRRMTSGRCRAQVHVVGNPWLY